MGGSPDILFFLYFLEGGAVKKPSPMREDLSVIESDLSEGLPRIVHGGGSPL